MQDIIPSGSLIFKSGFPISAYILLIAPVALLITFLILNLNLYVLAVYLPVAMAIFYVFFSRYSSKIEITNTLEMKVIYFFPWQKNITINLADYKYIDYARGFYNPFDAHRIGYLSLFRICYDLLMFSNDKAYPEIEIKVNLPNLTFRKILKHLQTDAKLQLIKLTSINDIIW